VDRITRSTLCVILFFKGSSCLLCIGLSAAHRYSLSLLLSFCDAVVEYLQSEDEPLKPPLELEEKTVEGKARIDDQCNEALGLKESRRR
jgi:hypothetical protein